MRHSILTPNPKRLYFSLFSVSILLLWEPFLNWAGTEILRILLNTLNSVYLKQNAFSRNLFIKKSGFKKKIIFDFKMIFSGYNWVGNISVFCLQAGNSSLYENHKVGYLYFWRYKNQALNSEMIFCLVNLSLSSVSVLCLNKTVRHMSLTREVLTPLPPSAWCLELIAQHKSISNL